MKLMLIHCAAETDGDITAWLDETERRGVLQAGGRLRPTSEATTVRGPRDR